MDEREKRRVGEQVEPGGRPKAPGRLELLQRFVNTWNHEFPAAWDRLGTGGKATGWLTAKRLLSAGAAVTDGDAARLRELREAVRALVRSHQGTPPPAGALALLRAEADRVALRVAVGEDGTTSLAPAAEGPDGVVASVLAVVHEARLVGSWDRLKACRQCGYVFYDRSKNRSGAWCAMSICGNRTKNRAYRRRRSVRSSGPRSTRGTRAAPT